MLLTEFNQVQYEKTIRQESWEEGLAEGEKRGEKKGEKKGRKEGETRLNDLYFSLMREGRMNDLERAMKDNDFRAQLFQSHNL